MAELNSTTIVSLLPASIKQDESVLVAAQSIDGELCQLTNALLVPALYSRIDQLSSEVLDHLSWQVDSKIWRDSWPINLKRSVIKTIIVEKSKKGTRSALENAVQSMGSAISVTEWWEKTPPGKPHTFDVTITLADVEGQTTVDTQSDLIRRINDVKPARSQLNFNLAEGATGSIYIGGAVRAVSYVRLEFAERIGIIFNGDNLLFNGNRLVQ